MSNTQNLVNGVQNLHVDDDLNEIPEYLRASIQKIIEKRVAERVDEEMKLFKQEIRAELVDQQKAIE